MDPESGMVTEVLPPDPTQGTASSTGTSIEYCPEDDNLLKWPKRGAGRRRRGV
ncbi:MAG: hypothetical protein U5R31_16710 [Acidimicrobiia bacterium]|nr:hypothetical protein [Acidimicrobiia bacterium]